MNNFDEIKDLENELDKVIVDTNLNVQDLKIKLIKDIQNEVKNIKILNELLMKFNFIKSIINYNSLEISAKNELYNIVIKKMRKEKINKLKNIIYLICKSNYLKKEFLYGKEINDKEIEILANDIIENITNLNFYSENEISKFICAYLKKFVC